MGRLPLWGAKGAEFSVLSWGTSACGQESAGGREMNYQPWGLPPPTYQPTYCTVVSSDLCGLCNRNPIKYESVTCRLRSKAKRTCRCTITQHEKEDPPCLKMQHQSIGWCSHPQWQETRNKTWDLWKHRMGGLRQKSQMEVKHSSSFVRLFDIIWRP